MSTLADDLLSVTLTADKDDVLLPITLKPRGRANAILGVRAGALMVSVTAAPVDGAANTALIDVLAAALHLPKSRIEVARGHKSRSKIIRLKNFSLATVRSTLAALG